MSNSHKTLQRDLHYHLSYLANARGKRCHRNALPMTWDDFCFEISPPEDKTRQDSSRSNSKEVDVEVDVVVEVAESRPGIHRSTPPALAVLAILVVASPVVAKVAFCQKSFRQTSFLQT